MNKSFFDISKGIANDFLQSIIFIDDNAYSEKNGNSHDFDALKISKVFSDNEKVCAVYKPETEKDIDQFIKISKKADVIILDWEINLIGNSINNTELADEEDEEADVKVIDTRGIHTNRIIKEILLDNSIGKNSLKLIIIYTGSSDLPEISEKIKQHLEFDNFINLKTERENQNCCLFTKNIRIQVVYKGVPESPKFNHNPVLKEQEIVVDELPNFVLTEFTKLTNGLLSNFALKALTEIRRSSHRILSLFSKEMDSAYLAHQSLLANSDDANELLVELLKDIFSSILKYHNINSFIDDNLIDKWIDENLTPIDKFVLKADESESEKKYKRDKKFLKKILLSSPNIEEKFSEAFGNDVKKNDAKSYKGSNVITLFSDAPLAISKKYLEQFAILTHHKNIVIPENHTPILSLGSVVESSNGIFYVCIQQRCDSVRIESDRRFLFISMEKADNNKFDFITQSGIKLKLNRKSYDIRTIVFKETDEKIIQAKDIDGEYFFSPKYYKSDGDERLKWIFELKDLHAQRIVANYCAELSRVGLDESEWLRLNQK
ncbi:MAG: hypothetical protein JXR36_05700 [Bacteroidales bacterium]|nr:hypothetical protein [Bacteroidales bacterium]